MSVSPGMGAVHAGGYFSREDYYLRGTEQGLNSRWFGEGSRELGLDGEVSEEAFRALCRGEDPAGGRLIAPRLSRDPESGELVESRRAGNDCTFSAPKSVSIAYAAGVDGVKEAHDAAVLSVLEHLEEHYCHYRSPEGFRIGKLVAAKFDHATSRNIDPQLHSHVFVVNAVRTPEGWRANEPRAIFQDQKSLGLLYRQELIRELEARGFGVKILDRSQLFFELAGVDPRLIEYFSSRRVEIEEQVALWRSEGRFPGILHGKLYEMAALDTRDSKRQITREDVQGIFERGFEACGSSMAQVKRELEEALSLKPDREVAAEGPDRAVELAVRELSEREAVLDRARILDQAALISGGRHGLGELNGALDGGAQGVVRLGPNSRGREFYTTSAMLELEAGNLEKVRSLARAPFPGAAEEREIAGYRERLALEGVRPTAGQWEEFSNEVSGRGGVALTLGDPGTAKTTTLGLIERFNEEVLRPGGREHFAVNLAYTGKAAREMALATGRPAFTVDSFLNGYAASKFDLQGQNSELCIGKHSGERILIPAGAQVVLRVDEASFLGARQAREILEVVEDLRERGVSAKLHLLGDTKQIQAIAAGDFLHQVRAFGVGGEVEYAHLTEILRQRDPELLAIAKGLNREDRPLAENAREALVALERRRELIEIPDGAELKRAAVEHYLEESRKPSLIPERAAAGERTSILMLTATNAERRELNQEVRAARVAAREIEQGRSFSVLAPARQGVTVEAYQVGDTVLFSGERGKKGRMQSWGTRLGVEGEVTGIDRERNLVRVNYSFQTRKNGREVERKVTRDFPAAEMEGKTRLFREEERSFSVGDRVVALKNDRRFKLQNGALGTIRELDERGVARVDLGDRELELDLKKYRQIDHAYAVTITKSQAATVEQSIMFARVRPEPEHRKKKGVERSLDQEPYGKASYNALNVALTRAQFRTRVYTNSIEGLARSVELADEKSSTLKKVPEQVREIHREPLVRGISLEEPGHDLPGKIRALGRAVPGPGEKVHRLNLENLKVPAWQPPSRELLRPLREIPMVKKDLGRELELKLPRKFGLELER